MKAKRRQKKKRNLLVRLLVVAGVAFFALTLLRQQIQLDEKQAQIDALEQSKAVATIYNEALQNQVDNFDEENMEQTLRGKGYVGPNDQVYQFVN